MPIPEFLRGAASRPKFCLGEFRVLNRWLELVIYLLEFLEFLQALHSVSRRCDHQVLTEGILLLFVDLAPQVASYMYKKGGRPRPG